MKFFRIPRKSQEGAKSTQGFQKSTQFLKILTFRGSKHQRNGGKLRAKLDKNEVFQDSSKIAGGGKVDTEIPKIKSVFENFEVLGVKTSKKGGKSGAKLEKDEGFQNSSKITGGGKVDTEIPKINSILENFAV